MLLRRVPREERLEPKALRELLRDPPARLRLMERFAHGLPDRYERPLHRTDEEGRVVALEVGGLGQHDVRVVDLIDGHDIDHHHQVQLADGLDGALRLRNALDHVLAVNDPRLDRVRIGGQGRVDEAVGHTHLLGGQRKATSGSIRTPALRFGEVRQLDAALRERGGQEDPALATITSEQRGKDRHGPRPLSVVAVPRDVPARMNHDGGPGLAHGPRGFADLLGGQISDRLGPLRRELTHMGSELIEALRVLRHIRRVIEPLRDENVDPGEQESDVGARPNGQPPVGFRGRGRETGIDRDELRAARQAGGEGRDLRGEDVLTEMGPDQDDELRLLEVDRFRRAQALAEGERIADIPRAAALREGGFRAVRRTVGLHEGSEEAGPDAVREEGNRLRAVFLLDGLELRGEEVERFVPTRPLELAFSALPGTQQRVLQPVGVVEEAGACVAARAQAAFGQWVIGIALEPDHLAFRYRSQNTAAPEAHLAVGRDLPDASLSTPPRRVRLGRLGGPRRGRSADYRGRAEKAPSREARHGASSRFMVAAPAVSSSVINSQRERRSPSRR